jgi:hypothetical protein
MRAVVVPGEEECNLAPERREAQGHDGKHPETGTLRGRMLMPSQ